MCKFCDDIKLKRGNIVTQEVKTDCSVTGCDEPIHKTVTLHDGRVADLCEKHYNEFKTESKKNEFL